MTRKASPNCPVCHGEGYDGSPIFGFPCPRCFPETIEDPKPKPTKEDTK